MRITQDMRNIAARTALHMWHVPEYRYFDIQSATRGRIIDVLSMAFRSELRVHYQHAMACPRSKKAMVAVYETARKLAHLYS